MWAALALAAAACGSANTAVGPGQLVRLADGRHVYLRCEGAGAPTVLFEGGFAATSGVWYKVQPLVARRHRGCAYDRAGYGLSDPGPMPRDGAAVARDLDETLRASRVTGPFVLVGHSAGGLYVRLFADRRPGDVIGMVLVDPSFEHQDLRFAEVFGPGAGSLAGMRGRAARCLAAAEAGALPSSSPDLAVCTPKRKPGQSDADHAADVAPALRPTTWQAQISELDTLWGATSSELDGGRVSYGDLPLIVLTAADDNAVAPPMARLTADALWSGLHREIAARSTRGSEEVVAHASHMMMFDRPDAIVAAIDKVIEQSKKGGRSSQ